MARSDLDTLLAAARKDRPADEVWPAAAAAIGLLWWHDRFADAYTLAANTIGRFRDAPGKLFDNHIPFDEAVLIGAAEAGEDPRTALAGIGENVPAESVLGQRLRWLVDKLVDRPPHSLVTGVDMELYNPRPATPLTSAQRQLIEKDPATLTSEEQRKLWVAARRSRQPTIALRLHDGGAQPGTWQTASSLARQLVKANRVTDATAVLFDSLDLWFADPSWHVTPNGIVLQPDLRLAVTPALREAVLDKVDISRVPGVET